jgi:hypothetical protein
VQDRGLGFELCCFFPMEKEAVNPVLLSVDTETTNLLLRQTLVNVEDVDVIEDGDRVDLRSTEESADKIVCSEALTTLIMPFAFNPAEEEEERPDQIGREGCAFFLFLLFFLFLASRLMERRIECYAGSQPIWEAGELIGAREFSDHFQNLLGILFSISNLRVFFICYFLLNFRHCIFTFFSRCWRQFSNSALVCQSRH